MSTTCQPIRDQIGDLESEIADLQQLLPTATPSEKADIIRQIREDRAAIQSLQPGLNSCVDTVQIQAILVSDDDGSHSLLEDSSLAEVTDQIKRWIAQAATVFARARLEFQFEGNDNDVLSIRNTLINNLGAGGEREAEREAAARACANLFPSRVVVFFRTVTGPVPEGACGPGCGFSSAAANFIVMPGFNDTFVCEHQNIGLFAHEAGHYFGLDHTFRNTFVDIDDAEAFFNANGNDPALFDGDGLVDTPPDPFNNASQCETSAGEPSAITLGGVQFLLPRNNIMSYYDSPVKTLTAAQVNRVRRTLVDRAKTGLSLVPRPVRTDLKDEHGPANQ